MSETIRAVAYRIPPDDFWHIRGVDEWISAAAHNEADLAKEFSEAIKSARATAKFWGDDDRYPPSLQKRFERMYAASIEEQRADGVIVRVFGGETADTPLPSLIPAKEAAPVSEKVELELAAPQKRLDAIETALHNGFTAVVNAITASRKD